MAAMRAVWGCAPTTLLQGERYGRELSGNAGQRGPNGPSRSSEGHRDRLDPVSRASETSMSRGEMLWSPLKNWLSCGKEHRRQTPESARDDCVKIALRLQLTR